MERIALSKNLYLDEYIPKDIYLKYSPAVLLRKINPKLVAADQILRDMFGVVQLNNWWIAKPGEKVYNYRGWRPATCREGGVLSDHREGNASDKMFVNYDEQEVQEWVKKNYVRLGVTILEESVGWVHTSVAYTGRSDLWIVKP